MNPDPNPNPNPNRNNPNNLLDTINLIRYNVRIGWLFCFCLRRVAVIFVVVLSNIYVLALSGLIIVIQSLKIYSLWILRGF